MVSRTIEEDRGQEDVPVCVSGDREVESEGKRETKERERETWRKRGDCERWNHKVLLVCLDRLLVSRAWLALWRLEVNLVSAAVLN